MTYLYNKWFEDR